MAAVLADAELRDPTAKTTRLETAIDKAEHEHDDAAKAGLQVDDIPVSPFRDMKRSKAIFVFWKVAMYAVLAAWTAIMDGEQVVRP